MGTLRVIGSIIVCAIVFWILMFFANFFVSLLSVVIDFFGVLLSFLAKTGWFMDFLVTVLEAGWIYCVVSYIAHYVALGITDGICEKLITLFLTAAFFIIIYDNRLDISLWGLVDYCRNTLGCTLWRSLDIADMKINVSNMRYTVFDIAVVLGGLWGVGIRQYNWFGR